MTNINSPSTHYGRLAVIGGSLALSVAILGAAIPAEAAPAVLAASRPSVSLEFAAATVASGSGPVVTYVGTALPSGTVLYLQRGSSSGTGWQDVARSANYSGTAKIPADPAGRWDYRMLAVDHGAVIAVSPDILLTVTGKPGSCGGLCAVSHDVLPWLKSIEEPVLDWAVGNVLDWIWDIFD